MIEITPPRAFAGFLLLTGLIVWAFGGCSFVVKAMHAQAMEYNEVYTGEDEDSPQESGKGDSKLPTSGGGVKKRKP
jgi:hypothetical protein